MKNRHYLLPALPTCTVCLPPPHHCPPSLVNKLGKDQVPGELQVGMRVLFLNTVSVSSSEIDVAVVAFEKS